ncbi:unnamed protein product [Bemisia tabaci]|uniref:Peptidase C1A papain C-terminal domain-containing protein n=2 Tax=Bemisia tabaci TaxID=7038 RepID=A0A9P0C2M9_BEMTA|nr:unnamed protein product [Bemisia tabaci]
MIPRSCAPVFVLCLILTAAQATATPSDSFLSDEYINHINSIQSSWTAGRNFEDSPEAMEMIKSLLGELPMEDNSSSHPPLKTADPAWPSDAEIPATFDARSKWKDWCPRIADIWDQSNCGSCWAVASSSAVTDRFCIGSKGKFKGLMSAQHVAFCCYKCGAGCKGGFSALAWEFFMKKGLVTGGGYNSSEGCQPYDLQPCQHWEQKNKSPYPKCTDLPYPVTFCEKKCTNKGYRSSFKEDKRKIKKYYAIRDPKDIQKDLMTYGPLSMTFVVYADFPSYKKGVYDRTTDEHLGMHAVKVIGWGTEKNTPYWLISNSWNEYWGDKGTFKILRGGNHCEIENGVYGGVPREREKW